MSRNRDRRPALLALGLALLLAGGCCSTRFTEDNLPRTRSLKTPFDAVDFVRFCVRHDLWDPLYQSLSRYTRKKRFDDEDGDGSVLFAFAFPRLTYGDIVENAPKALRDILVATMIHESEIWSVGPPGTPFSAIAPERQRAVTLYYEPISPSVTTFLLVNEGTDDEPRWTLALEETFYWLNELEQAP